LKIQNKILFGIFKIKYYFENTILHITGSGKKNCGILIAFSEETKKPVNLHGREEIDKTGLCYNRPDHSVTGF